MKDANKCRMNKIREKCALSKETNQTTDDFVDTDKCSLLKDTNRWSSKEIRERFWKKDWS